MGKTKIEWTEWTWNPVSGCSPVSAGCEHCYAARMAKRLAGRGGYPAEQPFAVTLHPDKLNEPLKWRDPQRVFVVSMGDLFHEEVPDSFITSVFEIITAAMWHTFQVLTKRPQRMYEFLEHYPQYGDLENVIGMTTVENQEQADKRIPWLLRCPFVLRGVSVEPLLGPVYLEEYLFKWLKKGLNWVIVGGETGPGARPMHPEWVQSLREQCQETDTPFFFKSWGAWFPRAQWEHNPDLVLPDDGDVEHDSHTYIFPDGEVMHRVGKRRAGRLLDGVEWNEFPEAR